MENYYGPCQSKKTPVIWSHIYRMSDGRLVMMGMVGDSRLQGRPPRRWITAHFQKPSDWQRADKNDERLTTSLVSTALRGHEGEEDVMSALLQHAVAHVANDTAIIVLHHRTVSVRNWLKAVYLCTCIAIGRFSHNELIILNF